MSTFTKTFYRHTQRILALFLAVSLITGSLPAGTRPHKAYALDYAETTETYDFTFKRATWKSKYADKDPSNYNIEGITYPYTGNGIVDGNWEYHSLDPDMTPVVTTFTMYTPKYLRVWPAAVGNWAAFRIKTTKAGLYQTRLNYSSFPDASTVDIHLIPASVADTAESVDAIIEAGEDRYYIGTVDFNAAEETKTAALDTVAIERAEEYVVVFEMTKQGNSRFNLRSLVLDGTKPSATLSRVALHADQTALTVGEQTQMQVSGVMSDEKPADLTDASITYESRNEAIATVDANGVVSAVSAGEAEISATVTLAGISVTGSTTITVEGGSGEAAILKTVSIEPAEINMLVGETKKITLSGTMSNDKPADLTGVAIVFHSGDEKVAKVDAEGIITARSAGDTDVTASVTLNGAEVTAVAPITVAEKPKPPVLQSIRWDLEKTAIFAGDVIRTTLSGNMDQGGAADLSGAEITYSSENEAVASITPTGEITAHQGGEAKLSVRVKLGEVTLSSAVVIHVQERGAFAGEKINYTLANRMGSWRNGNDIREITYAFTGTALAHGNWQYEAVSPGWNPTEYALYQYVGAYLRIWPEKAGQWAAFRIHVPKEGMYRSSLAYTTGGSSKIDAHLISAEYATSPDEIEQHLSEESGYKLGVLQYTATNPAQNLEQGMGSVAIEKAGEYILVLRMTEAGENSRFQVRGFTLDGSQPLDIVTARADQDSLQVGDAAHVIVSGALANGVAADLYQATKTFVSENPEIAAVTETGYITALSEGEATIRVSVTLEGVTKTTSFSVTVTQKGSVPPAAFSAQKHKYSFFNRGANVWLNPESGNAGDIRGITYDHTGEALITSVTVGNWEYHSMDPNWASTYTSLYRYYPLYLRIWPNTVGNWVAFKIKVPDPGRYRASLNYYQNGSAGIGDVYLMPSTIADVGNYLQDDYYKLGTVDFQKDGLTAVTAAENPAVFGEVTIKEAGEYLLVFREKDVTKGAHLFVSEFKLNGVGPLDTIKLCVPKNGLVLGESTRAHVEIKQDDAWQENLDDAVITYVSNNTECVTVAQDGTITAQKDGNAMVSATVTIGEFTKTDTIVITVGDTKVRQSYYTEEKRANIAENIEKYPWARAAKDSVVKNADKFAGQTEELWNMVTTQELPRSAQVGLWGAPDNFVCDYCGMDLLSKYGTKAWVISSEKWKIQCPDCRRKFPSNDFEKFYESGLDEHRNYRYELALQNGQEYLKNILYPEKGEGWGVDDGTGFKNGKTFGAGTEQRKTYVAYYNELGLWAAVYGATPMLTTALKNLRDAYVYTGDERYGRTGAILLDRIADVYPDFDLAPYPEYWNTHGSSFRGKITGRISEYNLSYDMVLAYDAFFPMMDDPQVISFLSKKAEQYQFKNPKTSAQLIRINSENGIIREVNRAIRDAKIIGNFGMHQQCLVTAAIVLDTLPETKEWIDFVLQSGDLVNGSTQLTGGNIYSTLINDVDRDGHGNESSPQYNRGWISNISNVLKVLDGYDKYDLAPYDHPKLQKMITAFIELTCCSRYTPAIGDSGQMGKAGLVDMMWYLMEWYPRLLDSNIAKQIYTLNGRKVDGLHADITTKDPEKIKDMVAQVIRDEGEDLKLASVNKTGYGFAILRDGVWNNSSAVQNIVDTQRDFWMYYGRTLGHGHLDKLNLGVHAYGLDMAPDFGYPEVSGGVLGRQFTNMTIAHNTVLVDEDNQTKTASATPLHFDDVGAVKVMDVDAPAVYQQTSTYRRTVVMVEANDEVSYGVDFFRVVGGNDHMYRFHAQSDTIYETEGLNLVDQVNEAGEFIGTYAGPDVEWGSQTVVTPTGYNWIRDVQKDLNPSAESFSVDWKITDFHNVLPTDKNLHLRLTMLNNDSLEEVSIVSSTPPRTPGNPERIKTVLARQKGRDLDTLFSSVIEPYDNERYIESIQRASAAAVEGSAAREDRVEAVKVTLTSGRVDYIIYASNNAVKYRIDDLFDFRGFVGVYSLVDGECAFHYIHDGDTIGDQTGIQSAVSGTVKDFTKELTAENSILIALDGAVDPASLSGKYIYVDNGGAQSGDKFNGVYQIQSATEENGSVRLHIGNTTLIREYADRNDFEKGYLYNIAVGERFKIPMSDVSRNAPVIQEHPLYRVEASSQLNFLIDATSTIGANLTYSVKELPRGAQFNEQTHAFTWIPDAGQQGDHMITFYVSDGLRKSAVNVKIKVYHSTKGDSGTLPPTDPPVNPPIDEPEDEELFSDLDGYDWAKEAIAFLAKKDIVQGVGNREFMPGAAVTRADFAILLVRAFALTSDAAENFADVEEDAYYADALRIARGSGIIQGVGNNCYRPLDTIRREDMMLMLYRTLLKSSYSLHKTANALEGFSDAREVSDYAKEAVSALIGNEIVQGSGGKILPEKSATRAEIAVMLYRILAQ